jgi:hypothetical protein
MLFENSPSPGSDQYATEPDDAIVLRIYRAASGQWAGTLVTAGIEFGDTVASRDSPEEVRKSIYDSGIYPNMVEVDQSPA